MGAACILVADILELCFVGTHARARSGGGPVQMSREIHIAEAQNQTASHGSIRLLIYPVPRQPVLLYTAGEQVAAISQLIDHRVGQGVELGQQ